MEGPYRFPAEGMFGGALSSMLGHQGKDMFAICTKCGVLVLLNDLVEDKEGRVIERSATKHAQWHEEERG